MKKNRDAASVFLGVVLVLLLFANNFMFSAKARIGDKVMLHASDCLGANYAILLGLSLIVLMLLILAPQKENWAFITGILASICFGFSVMACGQAINVVELPTKSARISMSLGSYLYLIIAFLIEVKCNEIIQNKIKRFVVVGLGLFFVVIILFAGQLNGLSVMVEYFSRKQQFQSEFVNHLKMSFSVVIVSVLIGVPLGWIAYSHPRFGGGVSAVLNTIESIPSLALISIMMLPLSFIANHSELLRNIGISGIGATPVFCALLFYALFQIVNSMYGALKVVDAKYIEVAQGMGMTEVQIFTKVQLPIIFPVIVSGIRVSLVSTILGVVIGSYVGYGGLGMFILQGLNGFAIDIVMLGTLPTIALVFTFDFVLKKLVLFIEYLRNCRGVVNV